MRTRTTTVTLAAALLLALTACSSTDDDSSDGEPSAPATTAAPSGDPTATPTETEAEGDDLSAAVVAYTAAYFEGDAERAYGTLSERCQGKVTAAQYGAVVEQAAAEYGPDHPATDVEAEVSGDLARVSYKVSGLPKFDQTQQPWAREDGAWKYDAC